MIEQMMIDFFETCKVTKGAEAERGLIPKSCIYSSSMEYIPADLLNTIQMQEKNFSEMKYNTQIQIKSANSISELALQQEKRRYGKIGEGLISLPDLYKKYLTFCEIGKLIIAYVRNEEVMHFAYTSV